jgi:hypothetical protein
MVFATTSKYESFTEDIWICDSRGCGNSCNSSKGMFNVEEIKVSITVGNDKSMMATKVGRMKLQVIQLDCSGLDITLHEVKFVP